MIGPKFLYIYKIIYFIYCCIVIIPVWIISYLCAIILSIGNNKREIIYNKISRFTARVILSLMGIRVKVIGIENIAKNGPFIFISNHQSFFDIKLSFACVPVNFSFISKESVFHVPIIGRYMKNAGHISLKRDAGKKAYETMMDAIKKLDNGKSLVIFPEGTRSEDGSLGEFKRGISLIVLHSGKPVVPMAIIGSGQFLPKKSILCNPRNRDITFKFGKPLIFPKRLKLDRDEANKVVGKIRIAISELLAETN